jgi:acetyltransferase EpsM
MKVVIIGGRGNGTVIASTIEDCMNAGQEIECAGFLNDEEKYINNYPVLGPINAISWQQLPDEFRFIYAMSNVKQASERYDLLSKLEIPEHKFANVIHPSAVVSTKATIGRGIVLMPFTLVGPDVVLGNHSQMFAQSFVGHDTVVEEMVFIANNASVGGRVLIKKGAHIGSNSSIIERIEIGRFAIVGIGSVVLRNVEDYQVVVGNPARTIRTIK